MLPHVSYWLRFTGLLVLLSVVASIDWLRYRDAARRWREYSFLIAAGLAGGIFGVLIDHGTATLSEAYFTLGKGIAAGPEFRMNVTALGFQAGFAAGAIIGGVFLLANNPKPRRLSLPYRQLTGFMSFPIIAVVLIAGPAALVLYSVDPFRFGDQFAGLMSAAQTHNFLTVWSLHAGVYLGAIVGTAYAVVGIRRRRQSVSENPRTKDVR